MNPYNILMNCFINITADFTQLAVEEKSTKRRSSKKKSSKFISLKNSSNAQNQKDYEVLPETSFRTCADNCFIFLNAKVGWCYFYCLLNCHTPIAVAVAVAVTVTVASSL